MRVAYSFSLCICPGLGRFWQRAHCCLLICARERQSLMAKTQHWGLKSEALCWPGSGTNLGQVIFSLHDSMLAKKEKKKRSLLSVLNMFSDPLCSTKVLFLWKHFSKQQRQWGGFLYIWKLIQIFLRCSKPFCNMCYLGQNFRFCQGKIFFWLWKMQVTGEEWRTEN